MMIIPVVKINEKAIDCRPADLIPPELDKLRESSKGLAKSEEDVMTFAMFPDIGREFLEQREEGRLVPEPLEPINADGNGHSLAATEFNISVHGETYHIQLTGTGRHTHGARPYYMTVDGMPEEILVEPLDEILPEGESKPVVHGKRPRATEPGHVTTSMPGTIVEVLVNVDDEVKAGAPVLITEAMKMETEVQAPVTGKVIAIHVTKGDSVTPEECLVEIK